MSRSIAELQSLTENLLIVLVKQLRGVQFGTVTCGQW